MIACIPGARLSAQKASEHAAHLDSFSTSQNPLSTKRDKRGGRGGEKWEWKKEWM